ncbi:MAG: AraC family transcriptional regulator, partial [Eggerthella sp.]
PRSKLRFMEVLLHVKARGLPTGRRHSYYTKSHMRIARTTHDRLCADLGCDYRLRDIADSFGISVTSLNNYFQGVYGVPVPTYLRERRLQEAAKLLEVTDESVATIAARVGYANPSKFSAAFKRRYNATPREYRTERR